MDSPSSSSSNEYTQEQLEAVRRIKRCKNHYELLGVSKEFTEAELKKQYRKMALQFHPDKNKTPGASEAFKAISNAFVVLSDTEKRRQYDLYGPEDGSSRSQTSSRSRTTVFTDDGNYFEYHRGFDGDVSAEELFNMFFGGGNVYLRRNGRYPSSRTQNQSPQQEPSGFGVLIQMLPVLFLVCLSMMSSFFVSDPAFSLQRTLKYSNERTTSSFKVPYYVKDNFENEYKSNLRRVEALVEEEYANNLRAACYREKNHRDAMLWRARSYGDKELEEKARAYKLNSCTKFNEMREHYVYY
ncbi:dnaJ homolog subfamily B member 12-like [Panonychus citri]|uniref:dnaJ homolog subfamily B member 12-like n=1 Tax=Panonychus citri TaxID=50023 RepID=UPI0023079BC3|nr:dnaJ homolog subfamily B member 12-like [Panonychus citri]